MQPTLAIQHRYRIARFEADAREIVRNHTHRSPHLFFLLSGSMTQDDGRHGTVVRPGTVRASASGARHAIDFGDSGAQCVTLHFFDRTMAALVTREAATGHSFSKVEEARALSCSLVDHASSPETELLADLDFYELMAAMATGEVHERPVWLKEAKALIMDNAALSPPIDDVARQLGVSREHLTRRYRKAYGVTPVQARTMSALTRAMCLMARSDIPLADAAGEAGFYDQAHFSNALKKATGRSPLEMRGHIAGASHFSKTTMATH